MYTKADQLFNKRIKPKQTTKGKINTNIRLLVKERSNGVCERCKSQRATQMAHIIGRKQINHVTTDKDLLHLCVQCHIWLDQTSEGIQYKRRLQDENMVLADDEIL